jgi:hypothetical protein
VDEADTLLNALPIEEFARTVGMSAELIRATSRGSIVSATEQGVPPTEVARRLNLFMNATIDEVRKRS